MWTCCLTTSSGSESDPLSLSLLRRAVEAFLSLALVNLLLFLLLVLPSLRSLLFPEERLESELALEDSGERDLESDLEEDLDLDLERDLLDLDPELLESDEELLDRDLERSEPELESELPLILLVIPILTVWSGDL